MDCNIEALDELISEYIKAIDKKNKVCRATLYCVTEPDEKQLQGIKDYILKEENAGSVEVEIVKDESLIGGFVIEVGNKRIDRSLKAKINEIKTKLVEDAKKSDAEKAGDIISILKTEVKNYEFETSDEEIGTVISVGDGIATIHGLEHVMYGEIVLFESGIKGMIQDIKRNTVGCIIFGLDSEIHAGTRVKRTYRKAGVPVGDGFIGRVVNALCEPIDGLGSIKADDYRLVENSAPSIVDRKSVSEPLETGILSIDSMFPIGRGQRELIIGDRQTGKSSIALDTILNQK